MSTELVVAAPMAKAVLRPLRYPFYDAETLANAQTACRTLFANHRQFNDNTAKTEWTSRSFSEESLMKNVANSGKPKCVVMAHKAIPSQAGWVVHPGVCRDYEPRTEKRWWYSPIPREIAAEYQGDTNMTLDSQLGHPNLFDLVGFTGELEWGVSQADFNDVYEKCVFKFVFGQNTIFTRVTLN
jgi:hypothetical protein